MLAKRQLFHIKIVCSFTQLIACIVHEISANVNTTKRPPPLRWFEAAVSDQIKNGLVGGELLADFVEGGAGA
jgi:hypothetical protein